MQKTTFERRVRLLSIREKNMHHNHGGQKIRAFGKVIEQFSLSFDRNSLTKIKSLLRQEGCEGQNDK